MIGEVQRLIDQGVEIDLATLARDPARMLQHRFDDVVGALAVLGDLVEIAGQHLDRLVDLGARVLVERGDARRGALLQLVEQLDRQPGEVVDEIERVLDLVRDAGGQLAERGHLLGLDQARLHRLQFGKRLLGGVAGGADFGFGALALGHVAIDQHQPAARHRIDPHLDDAPVRPGALGRPLRLDRLGQTAHFGLDVDSAVFAMLREIPDIGFEARPSANKGIRQVENALEVSVPGGEPELGVEHRDAVAHIVEGDAQFRLTLADLVEQPGIVHRDDRLRREALQHRDLLFR